MVAVPAHDDDDEINLHDLASAFWLQRWLILSITLLATVAAGLASLGIEKKYQATVIISPVSNSTSSGQLGAVNSAISQFSGLASLVGGSAPIDTGRSESLAVLQSEALTERYIQENDLLPILYQKQWDPIGKKWKGTDPGTNPTLWKANGYFKSKIRAVTTDTKTGLSTLTITWKDPRLAAKWANGLVRMANDYLRDQAIQVSERNIAYLSEQAAKTDAVGIKQGIYSLLQNEINKVMLARGTPDYALKVVDPAFVPEVSSSLRLPILLVIGFFCGLLSGLFVAFARNAWGRR